MNTITLEEIVLSMTVIFIFNEKKMYKMVEIFHENNYFHSYRKVASSKMSHAHAGFFRLLMKGIFDPYVPFGKKLIS